VGYARVGVEPQRLASLEGAGMTLRAEDHISLRFQARTDVGYARVGVELK
jgi:hypothetical protein